jgi:hypothetical protein
MEQPSLYSFGMFLFSEISNTKGERVAIMILVIHQLQ